MANFTLHEDVRRLDLSRLPAVYRAEAVHALLALRANPLRPHGYPSHELGDTGCRWIGSDEFRVVYQLDGEDVYVVAIGNRKASRVYRAAQARLYPRVIPRRTRTPTGISHGDGSPGRLGQSSTPKVTAGS